MVRTQTNKITLQADKGRAVFIKINLLLFGILYSLYTESLTSRTYGGPVILYNIYKFSAATIGGGLFS